jgi:hypothetical protein
MVLPGGSSGSTRLLSGGTVTTTLSGVALAGVAVAAGLESGVVAAATVLLVDGPAGELAVWAKALAARAATPTSEIKDRARRD